MRTKGVIMRDRDSVFYNPQVRASRGLCNTTELCSLTGKPHAYVRRLKLEGLLPPPVVSGKGGRVHLYDKDAVVAAVTFHWENRREGEKLFLPDKPMAVGQHLVDARRFYKLLSEAA